MGFLPDALKMWWSMVNLLSLPQGSVLGPLLFLNDLSEINLCQGAKITLFADDVLYYIEPSVLLMTLLNYKVGNWSSTNFLTLNRDYIKPSVLLMTLLNINYRKTSTKWGIGQVLTFSPLTGQNANLWPSHADRRAVSTPPTSLLLNGHPLDKVETFKYILGLLY